MESDSDELDYYAPLTREEVLEMTEIAWRQGEACRADDDVLAASIYVELVEFCETMMERYGELPYLLETMADYCADVEEQVSLYSRASVLAAERGLPRHTIHACWARILVEDLNDPRRAIELLTECRDDMEKHGDDFERDDLEETMRLAEEALKRPNQNDT